MTEVVHFRHAAFAPTTVLPSGAFLRLDGTEYGPYAVVIDGLLIMDLYSFSFEAPLHVKYDNFTAGTTGYGSSDVFSDGFASGPIPPWDSTFDDGTTTVAVSGGTLNIDNSSVGTPPGGFAFAGVEKTLGSSLMELWFQWEITLDAATITAVSGTSPGTIQLDMFSISSSGFAEFVDIAIDDFATGQWRIYDNTNLFEETTGQVPVADTPFTVGLHVIAT